MKDARTWGVLIGSKKKLRQILAGEEPTEHAPDEKLADDLLFGAEAVADFTGLTIRQVYHQKHKLGLRPLTSEAA